MLTQLQIRGYRGFRDLTINPLGRINLFAGKNNSGKSSLLETIFLLVGGENPQIATNINVIRGLELNIPRANLFWKQLFSDLNMEQSIKIEGEHKSQGRLALEIEPGRQSTIKIPLDATNRPSPVSATNLIDDHSLIFRYSIGSEKPVESRISLNRQGLEIDQPNIIDLPFQAIILLSRNRNTQENAVRLGELRKQKQGDVLLKALQVIEPKLQSIEDNFASGTPMIWGDIGLPELVPLFVMGEGMNLIARIVLAITSVPDGVVLVDEIETGLYHSTLPDVWRVIDEVAKQFNTQVFATTHSHECIEAAYQTLGSEGFLLHRIEVDTDKTNHCITYKSDSIAASFRHNFEVR